MPVWSTCPSHSGLGCAFLGDRRWYVCEGVMKSTGAGYRSGVAGYRGVAQDHNHAACGSASVHTSAFYGRVRQPALACACSSGAGCGEKHALVEERTGSLGCTRDSPSWVGEWVWCTQHLHGLPVPTQKTRHAASKSGTRKSSLILQLFHSVHFKDTRNGEGNRQETHKAGPDIM